jgi:hypothetical protein
MSFTFTGLYKFIVNALPLMQAGKPSALCVPSKFRDDGGSLHRQDSGVFLPLSEHPTALGPKHIRPWHSALAGTIAGGLAVLCEKHHHRMGIAQQISVRWVPSF